MNSTKRDSKYISQILILATSSIIAFAVLSICIWLYYSMRSEVEVKVSNELDRSISLVSELTSLKRKELKQLAASIKAGPLLKGALASKHTPTIEDVLNDIQDINQLDFVAIIKGKIITYSTFGDDVRGGNIKKLTKNHLIGFDKLNEDHSRVIIGTKLNHDLISTWEKITKSMIIITDDHGGAFVHSPEMSNLATFKLAKNLQHLNINQTEYYSLNKGFLKDTVFFHVLKSKNEFWIEFKKKRNSLIFLGVALFFIGIILSIIISYLIRPLIDKSASDNPNDIVSFENLILEIEDVKAQLRANANT